jgi:hypothetical protein
MKNSHIKPEIRFILLCSTTALDDEAEKQAGLLVRSNVFDWDFFYTMSLNFGVMPLIFRHLKTVFRPYVPETIYKKINQAFLANAARNMVLSNELLQILNVLETENILAVPFKGPVLADLVYGSDAMRMFSDLDILVQEKEAVTAKKILQKHGYQLIHDLDEKYDDFYIRIEHAFNMQSPDGKISIDLQWKLLGIYTPEAITLEKFKDRLCNLMFAGKNIQHLSHEDLLFYLCVHGTKDGWKKFEWICCIAEFIRKHPDLNWNRVIQTARKEHCLKKLNLGLSLSYSLCKAPLPDFLEMEIKKDVHLEKLRQRFTALFFSNQALIPEFTNNPRFSPFHIQVQDDFRNKVRYVFRQVFRPTTKEILLWPVPGRFTFLYHIFRPVRLIWKMVVYAVKKRIRK